MSKKAILLTSLFVLIASVAATALFGKFTNNNNSAVANRANAFESLSASKNSYEQPMEALAPPSGVPVPPWPVPPNSSTNTVLPKEPLPVNTVTERSVIVPSVVAPMRVPAAPRQVPVAPMQMQVAPRQQSVLKPMRVVTQVPVTQVPVQYVPVYPKPAVKTVVVRKYYRRHSGKVHVGRAVKHIAMFSLKLPFKLRP